MAAFTATATEQVREDIRRILKLQDPLCVTTGFDRPNLYFEVARPANKTAALLSLVTQRQGKCGIVYCATRNAVEKVCSALQREGISATRYHAGLDDAERRKNQDDFIYDRSCVMVATNAFGMGLDKSNVSYVIHYNKPKSQEAYYQEAGRAGRDGEPADCILLYSPQDIVTAKLLIRHSGENEELTDDERETIVRQDMDRLQVMIDYCKTTRCLRSCILDYFGQDHPESCGHCGNCRTVFTQYDMTTEAQMILSCVKRIHDKLGYYVGATLLTDVLSGSAGQRVMALGLDKLTTYGLMKGTKKSAIRDYIKHLEDEGYLYTDPEFRSIELTELAGDVLFHNERVMIVLREMPVTEEPKPRRGKKTDAAPATADDGLLKALKDLRSRLAREAGMPSYIIFSNAALTDMAIRTPRNINEFLEVSGVGQTKAARYGSLFLEEIKRYLEEQT